MGNSFDDDDDFSRLQLVALPLSIVLVQGEKRQNWPLVCPWGCSYYT